MKTRRQIMSQQIRLRRAQDKRFQRTNEPTKADVIPIKLVNDGLLSIIDSTRTHHITLPTSPDELLNDAKSMCYFCQKCKNHEILVWKKVRCLVSREHPLQLQLSATQTPMSLYWLYVWEVWTHWDSPSSWPAHEKASSFPEGCCFSCRIFV